MRQFVASLTLATLLLLSGLPLVHSVQAAPVLSISPQSGAPGTVFLMRGSGFAADTTIQIRVNDPDGQNRGFPGFTHADANGAFVYELRSDYNVRGGTHTVEVRAPLSLGDAVFTTTYRVDLPAQRCFAETGKCMAGRFLAYWYAHGDLAFNGYPISDEFRETLEDGNTYLVQYFERVRMEYHPEFVGTEYEVSLGQFGRRIHPADPPVPFLNAEYGGCSYYPQTGHNVCRFQGYYVGAQAEGGADFGLPLSEQFIETLEDGNRYMVQYFERARLEMHPEVGPDTILLGQFGRRIYSEVKR